MENKISPIAAVKTGWELTKENLVVTLGLLFGYLVINMLVSFMPFTGIWALMLKLVSFAISCAWSLGMTHITICAVDGEELQFSMFGEVISRFWSMVVMNLLVFGIMLVPMIVVMIIAVIMGFEINVLKDLMSTDLDVVIEAYIELGGLLFFIAIPCIYISIRLFFANYLLVDRGMGAVEAIKASWTATLHIQGRILVYMLLILLVCILGFICFFVGIFVSMIIALYAQAALYRQVFSAGMQEPLIVEDTQVVVNG